MHQQSSSQSDSSSDSDSKQKEAPLVTNGSGDSKTSSSPDEDSKPTPEPLSTDTSSHTTSSSGSSSSSSPESTNTTPTLDKVNLNFDFDCLIEKTETKPSQLLQPSKSQPSQPKKLSLSGRNKSHSIGSGSKDATVVPLVAEEAKKIRADHHSQPVNLSAQASQSRHQGSLYTQYSPPALNEDADSCGINCFKRCCGFIHHLIDTFANTIWVPIELLPPAYQPVAQIILTPILSNIIDLIDKLIYKTPSIASFNKNDIAKHITCRSISAAITATTGMLIGTYGPILGEGWIASENSAVQFMGLLLTDPKLRQPFFYMLGFFENFCLQKSSLALWTRCGPKEGVHIEDQQELNSFQQLLRNTKRPVTTVATMKYINAVDRYFTNDYSVLLVSSCILAIDLSLKTLSFVGFYDEVAPRLKLPPTVEAEIERLIDQCKTFSPEQTHLTSSNKSYSVLEEGDEPSEYTEEQLITHGGVGRLIANTFYYSASFAWAVIMYDTYPDLYKNNPEEFFAMSYGIPVGVNYLISNVNEIKTDVIKIGKHVLSGLGCTFFEKKHSLNEPPQRIYLESEGRRSKFSSLPDILNPSEIARKFR